LREITLHRNRDELAITESGPLVAYALRTSCAEVLRPHLREFMRLVELEIAHKGAIHMRKESGLFEGVKRG
jgi:hypothetical protein